MLHLTPNQPSACPESGTLGTVVRQDVRHNKRPAHTDWRNTDGWDLGGFPLGLRHMSGAEGPLGTPVQHCHSSLIESLIGQGNHMTNQEKILHSYYTTAVNFFLAHMKANSLMMPVSLSLNALRVSEEMVFHPATSIATASSSR